MNECEFVQMVLLVDTHLVCEPEYAQFLRFCVSNQDLFSLKQTRIIGKHSVIETESYTEDYARKPYC